jgi:hypothetical protein
MHPGLHFMVKSVTRRTVVGRVVVTPVAATRASGSAGDTRHTPGGAGRQSPTWRVLAVIGHPARGKGCVSPQTRQARVNPRTEEWPSSRDRTTAVLRRVAADNASFQLPLVSPPAGSCFPAKGPALATPSPGSRGGAGPSSYCLFTNIPLPGDTTARPSSTSTRSALCAVTRATP